MSFFKGIFNSNSSESPQSSNVNWTPLTNLEQLEEIINESENSSVLIFKHSTRCSVSRMALRHFEKGYINQINIKPYFLDLIEYREVSNAIAERFQVVHQSPQIVLIQKGKTVYHASHNSIDASIVLQYV